MSGQATNSESGPYLFGCQYVKTAIASANSPTDLAMQLQVIMQKTDFRVFKIVLQDFVGSLQNEASDHSKLLKDALKEVTRHFANAPDFKKVMIDFFNEQTEFPEAFLKALPNETVLVLSLIGASSKWSGPFRTFLQSQILPHISELDVDSDIVYEICSLNLDEFDAKSLLSRASSMDLVMFEGRYGTVKTTGLELDRSGVDVDLRALLNEADVSLLGSPEKLRQLLRFFPAFDHVHAAVFLLSIVKDDSVFKKFCDTLESHQKQSVFQIYRDIFVERKVDFTGMVYALDQPGFPALSQDACMLLFSMVCCCFEKQLIPSDAFTREWNNRQLQYSLLVTITKNFIPNLDFSKGSRQLNVFQLDIQVNTFQQCNNCWLSLDFAERVIHLTKDDEKGLERPLFKPLLDKYAPLILAIFGQTNAPRTPAIMSIAVEALLQVIQAGNQQIFSVLWKTSSQFLKNTMETMYTRQPDRIGLVFSIACPYLTNLYECENIEFVVDLAIYASTQGKATFRDFLSVYTSKFGVGCISRIADFIKDKVTESVASSSTIVSDDILNSFFQYLHDNGNAYPIEVRAFIQRTYMSCFNVRPKLKNFQFNVQYSASKLHEIKQTASMNYSKLIEDEVSVEEFLSQLTSYRTKDPKLYSCMIHFLLKELLYLDKHALCDVEKLADIVGKLLNWSCIGSESRHKITAFLFEALCDEEMTVRWQFACRVLTIILPKLSDEPQFVFDVVRNSTLRHLNPQLFEKVQKLAQILQEPSRSSLARTLTIHPQLKKFENAQSAPAKYCKRLRQKDAGSLTEILGDSDARRYSDWLALHIVTTILDQPKLARDLLPPVKAAGSFWKTVYQAACWQVMQLVMSPKIDTYEGAFLRRRLLLLGRLIGDITIASNRPLLSRFLDLKKLLLHGYSQGKLYAIVPFVCAILSVGSSYYGPRNPFIAGILRILASVLKADSVKLVIKHHIQMLFRQMQVDLAMFTSTPDLFPEKCQNNFDFLMPPFSLRHMASAQDVERICMFDEAVFSQFISQHIIIPDAPGASIQPEDKERMRHTVSQLALQHVRTEGKTLSRIASSTARELILKDFAGEQETEQMIEDAVLLTRQLAAGLTLFTAPAKISRQLCAGLRRGNALNSEWLDQIAQVNYDLIVQLLRDVVEILALKAVRQAIDNSDEARAALFKQRSERLQPFLLPIKAGPQQQQVYDDLNRLFLSQQPMMDLQTNDKQVGPDPEFDQYLAKFPKPTEYTKDCLDDSAMQLLEHCPSFGEKGPSFDRLRSILNTVLKWAVKVNHSAFDGVVCKILAHVCRYAQQHDIVEAQSYVLVWIRTTLRSPSVIRELLVHHLVTVEQLDKLFTELLNADPFNTRNAGFIIKFVHFALFEAQLFAPEAVISTLYVLRSVNETQIEQNYHQLFSALQDKFDEMDAPAFHLSSASKLQQVSTFDPLEEMQDSSKIMESIQSWKNVLSAETPHEADLEEATKECMAFGKNFFVVLFMNESAQVCIRFLYCVLEFFEISRELTDALVSVIAGNAYVVVFDMRKYYTILRFLLGSWDSTKFAVLLHQLRPLVMPSFTLQWIELATDKTLVYQLLRSQSTWPAYGVLVMDFAAALSLIGNKDSCSEFDTVYKGFLRFILILAHDFKDFVTALAPALVSVLPFQFLQVRNILLSTGDRPSPIGSLFSPCEIDKTLSAALEPGLKQLSTDSSYERALRTILPHLEDKMDGVVVRYFVSKVCEPFLNLKKSADVEDTGAYKIFTEVFKCVSVDLAHALVQTLVDQLRYKSKESSFYTRLLYALFLSDVQVTPRLSLSEIILRVALERASTPPPRPAKLQSLMKKLLSEKDPAHSVWTLPFVKSSEPVRNFLTAAQTVYTSKQK